MSISDEKVPVFEHQPRGESTLGECLGWVCDAAQACELLIAESEAVNWDDCIDIPGIGKSVFGGVIKGHIRVATDKGPYMDSTGLYRWQPCFYPFFDTVDNAGKPTPLDNVYIYKR